MKLLTYSQTGISVQPSLQTNLFGMIFPLNGPKFGEKWLLHRMMTSSNGNILRVTGHLCGEFTGPRWIPRTRPMTRNFDVFFDLRPNKLLNKQSWGWWFETLSRPLWRHRNGGLKHRKDNQPYSLKLISVYRIRNKGSVAMLFLWKLNMQHFDWSRLQ